MDKFSKESLKDLSREEVLRIKNELLGMIDKKPEEMAQIIAKAKEIAKALSKLKKAEQKQNQPEVKQQAQNTVNSLKSEYNTMVKVLIQKLGINEKDPRNQIIIQALEMLPNAMTLFIKDEEDLNEDDVNPARIFELIASIVLGITDGIAKTLKE
jgi:alanyl-tRNA synthetase